MFWISYLKYEFHFKKFYKYIGNFAIFIKDHIANFLKYVKLSKEKKKAIEFLL